MKKLYFLILMLCMKCEAIEYIDGEVLTLYKVLTSNHVVKLGVNPFNYGDGKKVEEYKRRFGIHNMRITIKGYEAIDLIKDDVCYYPKLFTLIAHLMSADNPVVQRWSCVKYVHPLSFAFVIESDSLVISSSLYRWKTIAPFLTTESIPLKPIEKTIDEKDRALAVFVNGKNIELRDEVFVLHHVYDFNLSMN